MPAGHHMCYDVGFFLDLFKFWSVSWVHFYVDIMGTIALSWLKAPIQSFICSQVQSVVIGHWIWTLIDVTIYLLKQAWCRRMWHHQEAMKLKIKYSEVKLLHSSYSEYLFLFGGFSPVVMFFPSQETFPNIGLIWHVTMEAISCPVYLFCILYTTVLLNAWIWLVRRGVEVVNIAIIHMIYIHRSGITF